VFAQHRRPLVAPSPLVLVSAKADRGCASGAGEVDSRNVMEPKVIN
jgi:hypothetical protein